METAVEQFIMNETGIEVNEDNRFEDCELTWDRVLTLMEEYRKQGNYFTPDEIRVIQETAYEAGANYQG